MNQLTTYLIRLGGKVDEIELNATSPIQMTVEHVNGTTTLSVCTDQSGLIGLLRYLHGLGFVILSVVGNDNER